MLLFIVKWEILVKETTTVLGFTSSGSCVRVIGYKPYYYVSDGRGHDPKYKFLRNNKKAEVRRETCKSSYYSPKAKYYEDDVDDLIKFISDNKLDYIGWVKIDNYIESKPCLSSCTKEFIVEVSRITNANSIMKEIPQVKVLSFDIECYTDSNRMSDARNPEDVIFMISMVFWDGSSEHGLVLALGEESEREDVMLFSKEFDMLGKFFEIIREEDPDVVIGYNIMGFDMKYIMQKYYSMLKNIPQAGRSKIVSDKVIHKSWKTSAYGTREYIIFDFVGRCCFDIYQYVSMELSLQKYSLDYVSQEILGRRKVDMPYLEMFQKYREGKIDEIAEYCYVDSELTLELWKKLHLWYAIVEQCKLYKVNVHEMYSSGQQKRIFNQLYYHAHQKNYVLDKSSNFRRDFSYQGATVVEPTPGEYYNVNVVDFASLYPSIIISRNICYTTHVQEGGFTKRFKGVIPEILEHLIQSRKEVKKNLKQEEDEVMKIILDKRQYAYKVCANSFYGAFGTRDDKYLQLVEAAEKVTGTGRELLTETIDRLKSLSCKVVYGDTDSCFFVREEGAPELEEIVRRINEPLEKPVRLEYEKSIDKMLIFTKKKYIYRISGKDFYKGVVTARRDTCFWVRKVYKQVVDMVMNGSSNSEVNKYLRREFIKILSGEVKLDQLYTNRTIGSNYKNSSYTLSIFKNIVQESEGRVVKSGERLEYYFIKSNHRLQGYHYATKHMIDKYKLELDFEAYINNQLKNPLLQLYQILDWGLNEISDS
ncbi:hypothetical protein BX667DRAFT_510576 [Coemansia mojavensis]|nr:hypothetical protein BX667DRAFT_510576 [Coemansia mojavensis]